MLPGRATTEGQHPGRLSGLSRSDADVRTLWIDTPLPDGSRDRREHYDVTWVSDDDGGKLFAYYKTQLAQGDWVEQSATADSHGGGLIVFNRQSDPKFGGTIYLAKGKIHVIMGQDCLCGVPT